ncbi:MAG: hypothetical protein ABJC26_01015 [Gemmatimonadaceae bacterium]
MARVVRAGRALAKSSTGGEIALRGYGGGRYREFRPIAGNGAEVAMASSSTLVTTGVGKCTAGLRTGIMSENRAKIGQRKTPIAR